MFHAICNTFNYVCVITLRNIGKKYCHLGEIMVKGARGAKVKAFSKDCM